MKIKRYNDLKTYTLTSSLTVKDIETVKKYRPAALKKKDADGNDIFAIGYNPGHSCVSANGVTFGEADSNGYLMIVSPLPDVENRDKAADIIADKVGVALEFIAEFEDTIPGIVAEINEKRSALIGTIEDV